MGDRVKQTFRVCLLLKLVFGVTTNPMYEDGQLYEGNSCTLANGKGTGTCVKFEECLSKILELQEGRYNHDKSETCTFEDFTEIVCCQSVDITEKVNNPSQAETACQEYDNEVLDLLGGRSVSFQILGGVDAETNEFPHMAALGYREVPSEDGLGGDIAYNCGGTLISRQHVLTAAHCVNSAIHNPPVEVRLGSKDSTDDGASTQRIQVDTIAVPRGYKRSRNYKDIALIKLKEPVRLTKSVQPACLLTKSVQGLDPTVANQTLVVTGWGVTEFAGEKSIILKKAVGLRFVDQDECTKGYENQPRLPEGLDNTMFCAQDPNRTRNADPCQGDSGGPILLCSGKSRPLIAGITSFGEFCGSPKPSVYTSIFEYLSWIEEQVWPSAESKPVSTN